MYVDNHLEVYCSELGKEIATYAVLQVALRDAHCSFWACFTPRRDGVIGVAVW
jgi:hypothetical protein